MLLCWLMNGQNAWNSHEKIWFFLKPHARWFFVWRPHSCWLYTVEDWRSHSAAVPLNFQPLRSNLSINLLNMHDSVPVLSVSRYTRGTRGGTGEKKEHFWRCSCMWCKHFLQCYDSGLFNELKNNSNHSYTNVQ